jgi:hypothetical protein
MTNVTALRVDPEGNAHAVTLEGRLEALRAQIGGGWLEAVSGDGWHLYCDEDGKAKALPVNVPATRLAQALGWPVGDVLCGPVLFLGDGPAGAEADAPAAVWAEADVLGLWGGPDRAVWTHEAESAAHREHDTPTP